MILTFSLGIIGLSIAQTVSVKYAKTKRDIAAASALYAAEAGISDTATRLTTDATFPGYGTKKTLFSEPDGGKADYMTTVTASGTSKIITATGYAYRTPTSTLPLVTRKVKVTISPGLSYTASSRTTYSVYAGPAGLSVSNGGLVAGKERGFGDVYVLGKLNVTTDAQVINLGFPFTPDENSSINVGNVACQSGTGQYPVACPSNQQPITYTGSLNGIICAKDQVINTNMQNTGLKPGCAPPSMEGGTFDKETYTSSMTTTKASTTDTCANGGSAVTWTANTTYTGIMSGGPGSTTCHITIEGNVYIKGDLYLNAHDVIDVPDSLGTNYPTVVVNGKITLAGGSSQDSKVKINSANSGVRFISFASSDTTCQNSDICSEYLSGADRMSYAPTITIFCTDGCNLEGSMVWSYHGTVKADRKAIVGMVNGQGVIIDDAEIGRMWDPVLGTGGVFGSDTPLIYTSMSTDILSAVKWRMTDYRQVYD